MKQSNKTEWAIWGVCALSFAVTLALLPLLPARIPVHWNVDGQIDGWAARPGAFFGPAMGLGLSLLMKFLPYIDPRRRRPLLANVTGGLSGSAVFPVAVRMVWQVYEAVRIPIIGMGGITSAEDVIEMMLAGAAAVQIGAANLVNPYACRDIIESLPGAMEKYRIEKLSDITGGAHA